MAVSKRLRFEILRRDNHTCYYCGRKPPEVELTIDHVVPQALGGTDEAKNLVACCKECNGGKTSIAPDSPLVAKVDADAERWSAAVRAAIDKANADHEATEEYRSQFLEAWNSYRMPAPLDELWRPSVESFRTRGLPIEILIDALHRAMAKPNITGDNKFRYMCGIAWKKVSEIEKHARVIFDRDNPSAEADEEGEDDSPTLKGEILPIIGQEAFEEALAGVHEWHEDCDNDDPERDEQDAIVSALYSLHAERHNLARTMENLLHISFPSTEVSQAFHDAREFALGWEGQGPTRRRKTDAPQRWRLTADIIISNRAREHMESLSAEMRDEWLLYAAELNAGNPWGWGEPTEEQLLQRAGRIALEMAAGWRFNRMCFGRGEHINHCPRRGTARIALAACTECGIEPLAAEVGLLVCDAHLERAIEKGIGDGGNHALAVTDFIVLEPEPENEVPF